METSSFSIEPNLNNEAGGKAKELYLQHKQDPNNPQPIKDAKKHYEENTEAYNNQAAMDTSAAGKDVNTSRIKHNTSGTIINVGGETLTARIGMGEVNTEPSTTEGGEAALLAGAEIGLELEQEKQTELTKIGEAKQALQDFRVYLAQSSDKAAQALPSEEELVYNYNPETKECEITRQGGRVFELDLNSSNLQGELPLPPQLMVTRLLCQGNELTDLTGLPTSLTMLICYRNQLTTLPKLPASLARLYCEHNQLTKLPELPANLTELYCGGNQLTTLPELPASLITLEYASKDNLDSDPATRAAIQAMIDRGGSVSSL